MIRCTKCQTINPPDAIFCSNCQSFLEWTGVKVDPTEVAAAADAERAAAEKLEAEKAEAEEAAAEKAAAERAELERLAAEKAAAKKAEAKRVAAEQAAAEKAEAKRVAAEQAAAEQAAAEQAAAEQAEANRVAAEKAAAEQAAAEKAASDKAAAEQEAAEKAATEKTEAERLAAERGEADRVAAEKAAAEQAEAEAQTARLAAEEARLAEEARVAEEARAAEEAKAAEEARVAEEARAAEEAKAAEEARVAEEARLAAEAAAEEEARRIAEAQAAEAARAEEEARLAEELRLAAEAKAAEDQRLAAEERRRAAAELFAAADAAREADLAAEAEADTGQPGLVRPGEHVPEPRLRATSDSTSDSTADATQREVMAEEEQPKSRQPTLDIPVKRPAEATPTVEIQAQPGDIFCRFCGTPNDPSRTFCRKCGKPLAAPAVAASVPWWRRLFQRKQAVAAAAGTRPKRMGEAGQPRPGIFRRLAPVVVIAVLAFGITSVIILPTVRDGLIDAVTDLRMRFFPTLEPILAIGATGDGESGHPAALAADDNTLTYWLVDPGKDAPRVTARFQDSFNLGALVLHIGSSTEADYNDFRRPKVLELSFPGTDQEPLEVTLTDTSKDQGVAVDPRDVTSTIVVTVKEWFESTGGDERIALREIEFKKRQ